MDRPSIHTSNIKASLKTRSNFEKLKKFAIQQSSQFTHRPATNSFFLFKLKLNHHTAVVTIYYKGHVNVTGVKSEQELDRVIEVVKRVPGIEEILSCSIDNLTSTSVLECGSFFSKAIGFSQVIREIEKDSCVETVKYSSQKFPGAFVRFKKNGTVTIFPSGKFNILGCRTEAEVEHTVQKTNQLINSIINGCHS